MPRRLLLSALLPAFLLAQAPAPPTPSRAPAGLAPITPAATGALEVLVVAGDAKAPVAGAMVNLRALDPGGRTFSVPTGPDGVARFALPPGAYRVGTVIDGPAGRSFNLPTPPITAGKTQRMEVTVPAKQHVAGIVRAPDGQPLAGVAVAVLPVISRDAVSDSAGKFDVSFDPQSGAAAANPQPGALVVVARDPQRNLAAALALPAPRQDLDLKLQPATKLTGQVTDPQGRPLAKATVWLYLSHAGQTSGYERQANPTDAQGRFEWAAVPTGFDYVVGACAAGFGRAEARISLKDPATSDSLALAPLELLPADKTMTGVVVDETGKPVPNALVYVRGAGQNHCEVKTNATGRFTLEKLCAGTVTLEVSIEAPIHRWADRTVEVGASDLRIAIAPK